MKLTTKETKFISHVKTVGKIYNIKCDFRNTNYVVADNVKCLGWFEENNNSLVIAKKRHDWIETLVHEYCHLTQYIENNQIYQKGNYSTPKMTEWLDGKYIRNINQHIDNIIRMELDNEKRSVAIIKKFGLHINVDNYIKKANAYLHFHNWLKETRRWSNPKNSPYDNKRIISLMSTKFNMKYDQLPKHLRKVFEEENI